MIGLITDKPVNELTEKEYREAQLAWEEGYEKEGTTEPRGYPLCKATFYPPLSLLGLYSNTICALRSRYKCKTRFSDNPSVSFSVITNDLSCADILVRCAQEGLSKKVGFSINFQPLED